MEGTLQFLSLSGSPAPQTANSAAQAKRHSHSQLRSLKQQHQTSGNEAQNKLKSKGRAMTVTAKAKTKFSSRNLNAIYKAPLAKAADNAGYHSGSRMLVLKSSNSAGGRSSILAAKSLVVAAPAPINTPSLRKENNGQDVHVNLVPTGKVGWGTSPRANSDSNNNSSNSAEEQEPRTTVHTHAEHSTTPYSSRSESSSRQVWGGGLAPSSQRQREAAQHHSECNNRAAFSTQSRPSGGVFSGVSSTGRWGDDAVEQDIARSDMMHAMQKERDFPQLKDNYANEGPYNFHAHDGQRFSDNQVNATSTSSCGYEQRHQRYDSYEFERRCGGSSSFHDDRFASRGYGGFDRSRGPPPNSYGNSNHGYYHPSDSRYGNYEHAGSHQSMASSSYHQQHPGSHDRYYDSSRREHQYSNGHPSDRYYGEDYHNAVRFQGRPYQIERRGCDAMPETHHNSSSVMSSRSKDNSQNLVRESENQKVVPWSLSEPTAQQLPSNSNAPHVIVGGNKHCSEPKVKEDHGNFKDAAPQSVSNSVWKKVDANIAQNCSSGMRPHASDHLPSMKSSSIHQPFAGGRPFSVRGDASTSSYRPSQVVSPAQSAPTVAPVRILKRDGPKMLFDPKTGTMVNAEEKSSSRNQRLPPAAAPSSSTVASNETETSGSSRDSVPAAELKPNTEASTGGVTKRTSHAKPDQIWKRSSSEEKASVNLKPENEETEPTPETTGHSKSIMPQAAVQQLSSKSLRRKKAKISENSASKKAVVKSKTKKYVLAYRPVPKPASDDVVAVPVDAETAPAPLPMKKFNELFAPSKPVAIVEQSAEPAATRADKSTAVKHSKKQSVPSKFAKMVKSVKSARRKTEIVNEDRVRKSNPKAPKVFRKSLESSASSEGCSTHSSNNNADVLRIVIEPPTATPSGCEDTPRVHHSKIRKGIDVDILKQIPEGGGVVVLTDTQEGIEFRPDDSENKFETVRSRRAVLLEKKQLREASAAVVQRSTPRTKRTHGVKQQITTSGIVMAAPSRTAKRTLVVGTRANARKSVAKLPKPSAREFQPKQPPVNAQEESSKSPVVSPIVQAIKIEQPKGNLRKRASSLPTHAQKLPSEHYKPQSDQPSTARANASVKAKQSLKLALTKRVYRELPAKKEDAASVQGNEVSAHPSSNQTDAAAGTCQLKVEEKPRDASTRAKKQANKQLKSQKVNSTPQSTPTEEKKKNAAVPTKSNGIHKEPTGASVRPIRQALDVPEMNQSTAQKAKTQRSRATVVPVNMKMKYVPKVPIEAASTAESKKPEPSKPEAVRLPEEATIAKSAKMVGSDGRRNSRKVKHAPKLSAVKAAPPTTVPADSVPKTKSTQRKSVSSVNFKIRAAAPPSDKIEAASVATQTQSRRVKEDETPPRKVSTATSSTTQIGNGKPKSVEPSPPLKKRLSKSRAESQTSPPIAKSYKQIYVVKSSSSTSSPAPSSSAA